MAYKNIICTICHDMQPLLPVSNNALRRQQWSGTGILRHYSSKAAEYRFYKMQKNETDSYNAGGCSHYGLLQFNQQHYH